MKICIVDAYSWGSGDADLEDEGEETILFDTDVESARFRVEDNLDETGDR